MKKPRFKIVYPKEPLCRPYFEAKGAILMMTLDDFYRADYDMKDLEDFRARKWGRSPLKAIKQFCYQCSGYSWVEVNKCVIPHCPLYEFRFGKRPKPKEQTKMKAA